jgi:hypothetical protein
MAKAPEKPLSGPGSTAAMLAAAVLLFLLIGSAFSSGRHTDYPPNLSFSPDTDGLKAVRTLLERRVGPVNEHRRSWSKLPSGSNHVLLSVAPLGVDEKEEQPLLEWVQRGNRLIIADLALPDYPALPGLEIKSAAKAGAAASTEVKAMLQHTPEGVRTLMADMPLSSVRLSESREAKVLLTDDEGMLAASYTYGQGQVTVILVPEWLRNERILKEQHFELLWPILLAEADSRNIWFDEYHHGYQSKPGVLEAIPGWLLAVYAELILAALFWLWIKGKRFGPVRTPREWVVLRGDETLKAVAGWFRRRGLAKDAISGQEQYLRLILQERWGVRSTARPEELVRAARMHTSPRTAQQLEELLGRLQDMRNGKRYSSKAFLSDSVIMAEIIEAVEQRSEGTHGKFD